MISMRASFKLKPPQKSSTGKIASSIRKQLRYRFAELLSQERFDQALREAEIAHHQHSIMEEDLRFVRDIVENSLGQKRSWSLSTSELNDLPHDFSLRLTRNDTSL